MPQLDGFNRMEQPDNYFSFITKGTIYLETGSVYVYVFRSSKNGKLTSVTIEFYLQ